jgi:hypothetical protein
MCSADLNMGAISGTTHIKKIFSLWTGTGRHFIRNKFCHATHILHFSAISNVFCKPQKKKKNPEESNLEDEEAKEWLPLFLPNDSERHQQDGRSGVVHHLTGKLFPQGHEAKRCSPS